MAAGAATYTRPPHRHNKLALGYCRGKLTVPRARGIFGGARPHMQEISGVVRPHVQDASGAPSTTTRARHFRGHTSRHVLGIFRRARPHVQGISEVARPHVRALPEGTTTRARHFRDSEHDRACGAFPNVLSASLKPMCGRRKKRGKRGGQWQDSSNRSRKGDPNQHVHWGSGVCGVGKEAWVA